MGKYAFTRFKRTRFLINDYFGKDYNNNKHLKSLLRAAVSPPTGL
jgi:hypothetical protein